MWPRYRPKGETRISSIVGRNLWSSAMLVVMLIGANASGADPAGNAWTNETETNVVASRADAPTIGSRCLSERLEDRGIELGLGLTNVNQQTVRGGLSRHRRAGRLSGSYDLELTADLERLLGFEDAIAYVHAEGSWSKSGGIDKPSVGSAFGLNADGNPRRAIDVTELWYEQSLWSGALLLRIGKMDLTGGFECRGCPAAFDRSMFANDETSQFLNGALVNNPTIPFPDYALGVAAYYQPGESWYIAGGVTDAQNDARETGFRTAFHGEDYFFYILETGVTAVLDSENGPLQGAYRIGLWNDPQPKANSDRAQSERDDIGFYISCGQVVTKENGDPADSQGLGVFARYGHADGRRNDVTDFWTIGFQYQGLIKGRDEDVLGVGYAQGVFSDSARITYREDYESVVEVYYNAKLSELVHISPSVQYIANPGGAAAVSDVVVFGVRMQFMF